MAQENEQLKDQLAIAQNAAAQLAALEEQFRQLQAENNQMELELRKANARLADMEAL